ncbi:M1 family metallopeptidase [Maribellus maritimus]|uniref:M1 family metallopeptidase n=1 Tax=Maribellus maritimus TaxID=2870838 RepID=UPI001EEBDC07|nr:M1 family metallopeptidase [Maribellus maritimus]MCG6187326.1 M1 family metallopeptidase [Maribellus maritimus]
MIYRAAGTLLLILGITTGIFAQKTQFTHQDSLRGTITPERAWWDLTYYHLSVKVTPDDSTFSGTNLIQYRVIEPNQKIQIDLQPPMEISKITQNGEEQKFERDGNAWFISLSKKQQKGEMLELMVEFNGKPKVSRRPPWDGGVSWKKDEKGRPFIVTTNQGDGASLWWPCKDHPYDEPDSMLLSVTFPKDLMDVSNGKLIKLDNNNDGTKTAHWFVNNPINSYGVNINIGNYVHFGDTYKGEKGTLDCNFWVMDYNLEKAKKHFKQAYQMLEAFEYWFGPYPFYNDGYKLVEVPYPGMEHQSSVTYGNGFKNGYGGRDESHTGYGMKFDFIIIHESGHEWFANNVTNWDEADMWIHESFTAYSESLFVEYFWGKEAGAEYCRGTRLNISNDRPIIGVYGVNYPGSGDMYSKGANMLHTLRQIVNDDKKWRKILRGLNETFYHQTVKAEQIEKYISGETELDLESFFNQYLRDTRIPTLEYAIVDNEIRYRWTNCVNDFNMPVKVYINGEMKWIQPTGRWSRLKQSGNYKSFEIDKNFYVAAFPITVIN